MLTFWREDFEKDSAKHSFQIRKCQILGLQKWSKHVGVFGFIINFRSLGNKTFFIGIEDFISYTSTLSKKTINVEDVFQMNPIEIENKILRTNYRYDIKKFLKDTAHEKTQKEAFI